LKRFLIVAWLLLIASLAQGEDLRVQIYYQRPPQRMTVVPSGKTLFKNCASCISKELNSSMRMEAVGETVHVGSKQYSGIWISGYTRLEGFEHPPLSTSFPLEIRSRNSALRVTLSMPLEEYVAAVLAAEAGNFDSEQALQAMAVAARTFAVHFRARHKGEAFDFCDTTHCQDFHLSAVDNRVRAAVDATEGEMLWYQGATAATYYHQNCGGRTADKNDVWPGGRLPYLRAQVDPYCSRQNSGHWQTSISKSDIGKALTASALDVPSHWRTLEIQSRSQAGRVVKLRLVGDGSADETISASTFRFAIDRLLGWSQIRSDLYELHNPGEQIVFSGRGSGHGVGMCQTGAVQMGHEGKSYRDILAFYYPGTVLGLSAQGLAWQVQSGERLELISTHDKQDARLIAVGERLMREAEDKTGMKFDFRPRLKVYPTLASFRDSTGEAGWVAASSRGSTIRLQPSDALESRGVLDSTLRHEMLHQLIESHAKDGLPVWFREGLVLCLARNPSAHTEEIPLAQLEASITHSQTREQIEQAYNAARGEVSAMMEHYGRATVMSWLVRGLPSDIVDRTRVAQASQK
jgi:stage II sporulation protein D